MFKLNCSYKTRILLDNSCTVQTLGAQLVYFIEGRSLSRQYRQDNNRGFAFLFIALLIWLIYQCLNGAISSRNCSIKAPDKLKSFVFAMT